MKKYFEKFKDLKSTNKKLYYATICMFVLVGFTFAYVIDQISGGAISKIFITADTADSLEFLVDKDISIKPTQFNFTQGGVDLSDTATATARLKANSTDNTASYTYNVYFEIETNEYIYTTADKKPEMLLQVTNPNGENMIAINGLTYNETLQGFDITENEDLIQIANNYEITSNSSSSFTEQNWIVTVKFINLDTNQIDNEGKTLEGKILIQRNEVKFGDVTLSIRNFTNKYGANTANLNCNKEGVSYDLKNNSYSISSLNGRTKCNVYYEVPTTKEYLNNKVISLSGTTQGVGQVVNEKFVQGIYTNATPLTQAEYGTTNQYYGPNIFQTSGTTVTNAFSYVGTEWASQPSNMISNQYYHINFTIPSDGYYQICFEISSGDSSNHFSLYTGTTNIFDIYSSSSSIKSGCIDLGRVTSGTNYRVVQGAGTTILTMKFSVKMASDTKEIDAGYRYEGKNPNNWVWFNNELWRIIGVFDEETHGQTGLNLVKIIRANPIGGLAWNKATRNDWSNASLKNLLNGAYYNKENGNGGAYCYAYSTSVPGNCDYSNIGIDATYRSMIKSVIWKVGGHTTYSATSEAFYTAERGSTAGNSNAYAKETTGYIGLMYPSDYGYSVLASSCARTTSLGSYNTSTCAGQSWLAGKGYEWTLTPYSTNSNYVFNVSGKGYLGTNEAISGYTARPSLYLDAGVYVIDGTGTETNPYIIRM